MPSINQDNINMLLAQIILSASKLDDWQSRELGAIHYLKYLYLADLFWAEDNDGETLTQAAWQFYKFGPWNSEVYNYLDSGLNAVGAGSVIRQSKYYDDSTRWKICDQDRVVSTAKKLNVIIASFINSVVQKYANYTSELLDFVYKTPPMLKAKPLDYLKLTPTGFKILNSNMPVKTKTTPLSAKQQKKIQQWKIKSQALLKAKFEEIQSKKPTSVQLPEPRYDDLFFESLSNIDPDMTLTINGKIVAEFDNSVWESKARDDSDVS